MDYIFDGALLFSQNILLSPINCNNTITNNMFEGTTALQSISGESNAYNIYLGWKDKYMNISGNTESEWNNIWSNMWKTNVVGNLVGPPWN